MKATDDPIVVEETYDVPVLAVWNAISKSALMRQWYFEDIPSFEAETGFETQFTVRSEGRDFTHIWKVTDAVPLKKLSYDWKYKEYPGDGFVVWELFEDGDATRLRVTTHVREDFPDDVPEFTRESCIMGWEYFIQGRLKEFLARE